MQGALITDFFLYELKYYLDFRSMYNLKYVNMYCYDKIKFDDTKDFYIALKIEEIFKDSSNDFKKFMEEYDLCFHKDFVTQCILNVFWDENVVTLWSKNTIVQILADKRITCVSKNVYCIITCTLFYRQLNIFRSLRERRNIVDIVTNNYELNENCELKENEIVHFIKQITCKPIIICEHLDRRRNGSSIRQLGNFTKFYDVQSINKPLNLYLLQEWPELCLYGHLPAIGQILVYHMSKKRYVFDNEVGSIVNGKISRFGRIDSSNLHSDIEIHYEPVFEIYYKFDIDVLAANPSYECDYNDDICPLNEIGYIKHFHDNGGFIGFDICLYVIEYSDIAELSNYKKFFDN